jgi:hypothetical protein
MYKITFSNANLGTLQLQHLPLNIDDIQSYFLRSEKYYGVLRQIEDVSFIWVKDAADYIRNVVNAFGVQSVITVSMQYTDNNIDYEQFYSGILDLKAFTDDTIKIECRIISSSSESKLLNNLETQYKLWLPSALKIRPKIDEYAADFNCLTTSSIAIKQTINPTDLTFTVIDSIIDGDADRSRFNNNAVRDNAVANSFFINSIYTVVNEISNVQFTIPSIRLNIYYANGIDPSTTLRMIIYAAKFNSDGTLDSLIGLRSSGYFAQGGSISASSPYASVLLSNINTTTIAATEGQRIAILIGATTLGGFISQIDYKFDAEFEISLSAQEYKTETTHRCISIRRAFERLIDSTQTNESSTSDPATTYTEGELIESTRYGRTVITSGFELRKATGGNGHMVTSISDLWDALNTPFCLGMGLRKQGNSIRVTIDHRTEFFKPQITYDLGEVTDFKIEFDETYVQNVLNIVYPGVDNNDFPNGIYEYLTKYGYTLPSNYVDNSLEINCPYKVDATSVEKVRTNSTSETQDSVQDDESNFLIRCYIDGSDYYSSRGEEFDSISQTGLQNDTQLFNVDMFAPVAMRFWAWWILSGLKYYSSTDELVMQRNYPNADVAITVDGIVCDTNNISLAKLRQLAAIQDYLSAKGDLFEPFAYTFKAPVSAKFINIYNNERHGVLQFSYKNVVYKGFGMKVPALPNKAGEFRLLKLSKRGESLCV